MAQNAPPVDDSDFLSFVADFTKRNPRATPTREDLRTAYATANKGQWNGNKYVPPAFAGASASSPALANLPARPLSPEAQQRILGATRSTPMTAEQVADKAAFDSRFTPSGTFDPLATTAPVAKPDAAGTFGTYGDHISNALPWAKASRPPLAVPPAPNTPAPEAPGVIQRTNTTIAGQSGASVVAPVGKPDDVLSGIPAYDPSATVAGARVPPTFGGKPLNSDITTGDPAIAPTLRTPNTAAVAAGAAVGNAVATVNDVTSGGRGFTAAGLPIGRPIATSDAPIADVPGMLTRAGGAIKDFVRGAGRAIASGVSNSQAAGFEQPTKENPIPVTPTTPVAKIDRTDDSIAKFGVSDDDWKNRKLQFAGF